MIRKMNSAACEQSEIMYFALINGNTKNISIVEI